MSSSVSLLLALLGTLLIVPIGGWAAAATPERAWESAGVGPHDWTTTDHTIPVLVGPDDVSVDIDATLWTPAIASAATPQPAILQTNGFGGTKDGDAERANAAFLASHDYNVLVYSAMGHGASGGCITMHHQDWDIKAASQLIDWLTARPEVALDGPDDPKLGLIGGSYGGGWQGRTAVTDGRVDAIVPGRTWTTLQYSLVPNNWVGGTDPWDLDFYEQGVFQREWTSLFFAVGQAQPAQGAGGCDVVSQQALFPGAAPCSGFHPEACRIYAQLVGTGDVDPAARDFVGMAVLATVLDQLDIPTMLPQGQLDTLFTPTESIAIFENLRSRSVPVAMIWHSGGHGYLPAPGDGEAYGGGFDDTADEQVRFANSYLPSRTLAWFDRWVRGDEGVETGPAFAWFRAQAPNDVEAHGGTAAAAYGTSEAHPPSQSKPLVLALDPAGSNLVPAGADFAGGVASFLNPAGGQPAAYRETANFTGPGQPFENVPPQELAGQHVLFETDALEEDVEVVGAPIARLHLAHQNLLTDAFVFAKLYDVAPDGTATLLRRQVSAARLPNDALAAGPVDIRLVAQAWTFEEGHRLRLVLASTDKSYAGSTVADQLSISSTPDEPSQLILDVIAASDEPVTVPDTPVATPQPSGPEDMPATGGGAALAAIGLLMLVALASRRSTAIGDRRAALPPS